jgi:hypothetical protein
MASNNFALFWRQSNTFVALPRASARADLPVEQVNKFEPIEYRLVSVTPVIG